MANTEVKRPLRKGAKSHYLSEKIDIADGLSIVKTNKSGKYWSLSCYIPANKRNYRKSLRTDDPKAARNLAIRKYAEILQQVERGESPLSTTAKKLVELYTADQKNRVTPDGRHSGGITEGRLTTITSALKQFIKFVGADTKLDKVKPEKFQEYHLFRRSDGPVSRDTLKNEHSLIRALFKFAIKRGLVRFDYLPDLPKITSNTQKYSKKEDARDAFNDDEMRLVLECIRSWDENVDSAEERYERWVVRDFIDVGRNTGLRFGEMRKLTWAMVELPRDRKDRTFKLLVPWNTKTGARPVQGVSGDAVRALLTYSPHKRAGDYVFADWKTGKPFSKRTLYRLWELMKKTTGLQKSAKKLTFYSLRHTYCTERLLERTPVHIVAQNMGTSVKYIEDHYSHVTIDLMKDDLTKATRRDAFSEAEALRRAETQTIRDRGMHSLEGARAVGPVKISAHPPVAPVFNVKRAKQKGSVSKRKKKA